MGWGLTKNPLAPCPQEELKLGPGHRGALPSAPAMSWQPEGLLQGLRPLVRKQLGLQAEWDAML